MPVIVYAIDNKTGAFMTYISTEGYTWKRVAPDYYDLLLYMLDMYGPPGDQE